MLKQTAFYWDETCFWHAGAHYAQLAPVGGLVQPMVSGGSPEAPEAKRRLKNLMDVTGLSKELSCQNAEAATQEDLLRIHPEHYLAEFKRLSDAGGGELGLRTPFGPGAFEIAAQSAGLVIESVRAVCSGDVKNTYALSRPPGHHCLPDWPNGFCLLANIPIAVEAARAAGQAKRIAIVDWDVHHGNGTEAIYLDDPDILAISIHQERCYPQDTGAYDVVGTGPAKGANMNIPLPPGCGHLAYLEAMERLILPKLKSFNADLTIVACGYDAASVDPLSRMMCTAATFKAMTKAIADVTNNRFVVVHEGGYSEMYVPFCGHAVLEQMSGTSILAGDPIQARVDGQQPNSRVNQFHSELITDLVAFFELS